MKRNISNKIAGALVLAAAGLPLAAQAATEATVQITATVSEKLELAVDKATVTFTGDKWAEDIVITTSHNTGTATNITISNETGKDDHFNLVSASNVLPVTATIKDDTKAKFDNNHIMTHTLGDNANGKKTTLHLAAQRGDTQMAGKYTGSLVIKINKA